jgi:hypothetical protein
MPGTAFVLTLPEIACEASLTIVKEFRPSPILSADASASEVPFRAAAAQGRGAAMRRWWLERFTLDEIRELGAAAFRNDPSMNGV